jgi:ketol-acid reductoisomerase
MTKIITRLDNEMELISGLKRKIISVIGYGNQGRSQALNMRDSGLNVIIGNERDRYALQAENEGFKVKAIEEATKEGDIIFLLIPDEIQQEVFKRKIEPNLGEGKTLVFASGYNYFYGFVKPERCDVLMIAPRMIGWGVRDYFLKGKGFPVLIAVGNNYTGRAEETLLALTASIGALKSGGCAVYSSFREETLLDLLSEHTWAGAILYMFRAFYEVATELGASPEATILELYGSGELAEIAESMKDIGLFEQLKTHSRTSQYGQLTRGPLFVTKEVKELIRREAMDILNGNFAREWALEQQTGLVVFNRLKEMAKEHPMEVEEKKLYKLLRRIE